MALPLLPLSHLVGPHRPLEQGIREGMQPWAYHSASQGIGESLQSPEVSGGPRGSSPVCCSLTFGVRSGGRGRVPAQQTQKGGDEHAVTAQHIFSILPSHLTVAFARYGVVPLGPHKCSVTCEGGSPQSDQQLPRGPPPALSPSRFLKDSVICLPSSLHPPSLAASAPSLLPTNTF